MESAGGTTDGPYGIERRDLDELEWNSLVDINEVFTPQQVDIFEDDTNALVRMMNGGYPANFAQPNEGDLNARNNVLRLYLTEQAFEHFDAAYTIHDLFEAVPLWMTNWHNTVEVGQPEHGGMNFERPVTTHFSMDNGQHWWVDSIYTLGVVPNEDNAWIIDGWRKQTQHYSYE